VLADGGLGLAQAAGDYVFKNCAVTGLSQRGCNRAPLGTGPDYGNGENRGRALAFR